MNFSLTEISQDTIIQAISILAAALTFVIAQAIEKRKDRKQANRESYQQLEFASIDLFRFEAENIDLIRPIWEEGHVIPDRKTAEYIVLMNYVCQMLNLFEMALKFRKDKTLLPEVFGTWIAWFQLLICSPGFHKIWEDVRMDYLPELREIMDGGIRIARQETDEDRIEEQFNQLVAMIIKCNTIPERMKLNTETVGVSLQKPGLKKEEDDTNITLDPGHISCKWVQTTNETKKLTTLFIDNSKEHYISHSEIQEGRAIDERTWSNEILAKLTDEFNEATENDPFCQSNIVAAYHDNTLVAFALVEYKPSPNGTYAVLSDIVVEKAYRKNRIGETLFNWFVEQLDTTDIKNIYAESNIQNSPAHQFLTANGFKPLSKVFKLDRV